MLAVTLNNKPRLALYAAIDMVSDWAPGSA
jgi:hypothetical protein